MFDYIEKSTKNSFIPPDILEFFNAYRNYFVVGIAIIIVIILIFVWNLYNKLGIKWWESLIPIYNIYVLIDVLKMNQIFVLLAHIPIINLFVLIKLIKEITLKLKNYSKNIELSKDKIEKIEESITMEEAPEDNRKVHNGIETETIFNQMFEPTELNEIQAETTKLNNDYKIFEYKLKPLEDIEIIDIN